MFYPMQSFCPLVREQCQHLQYWKTREHHNNNGTRGSSDTTSCTDFTVGRKKEFTDHQATKRNRTVLFYHYDQLDINKPMVTLARFRNKIMEQSNMRQSNMRQSNKTIGYIKVLHCRNSRSQQELHSTHQNFTVLSALYALYKTRKLLQMRFY
jgi:hypothetical protein